MSANEAAGGPLQTAVALILWKRPDRTEMVLDRIRGRTGIVFDIINEAEESRLMYLALRRALGSDAAFTGAWTLLAEVGGGSTSLTLLRRGQPNRSGVYALGAIRLRQRLDLRRHPHDLQIALLKRAIANVIDEIRLEIPLRRISHVIAIGGQDVKGQPLGTLRPDPGQPPELVDQILDRALVHLDSSERQPAAHAQPTCERTQLAGGDRLRLIGCVTYRGHNQVSQRFGVTWIDCLGVDH